MPQINISGGGGSTPPGGGGGKPPQGQGQFFKLSAQESAAAEMRLRKMLTENERRLYDQAFKAEKDLAALKSRTAREQFRQEQVEQKRLQQEKVRADRDYTRWWQNQTRQQEQNERRRRQEEDRQNRPKGPSSRAYGHAARVGGIIGGLASGDPGRIVSELGGVIGAELGLAIAGPVGEVVGAAIGSLARYALNPSGPVAAGASDAIKLQQFTYGAGRAGNFSGARFYNSFNPGTNQAAPWMQALGVGYGDVQNSIGAFGGVPGSFRNDPMGLGRILTTAGSSPAYAGLPAGTAEAFAHHVVGMGGASSDAAGLSNLLINQLPPLLEQAYAKGADRSQLLSSIQNSLDTMARAGAANVNAGSAIGITSGLFAGGSAGGLTGSTAANYIAGLTGAASNPTSNMLDFYLLSTLLPQYGGLKTPADVKKFLGPGVKMPASSISSITGAAQGGNSALALMYAMSGGLSGDPARMQALLSSASGGLGLPGYANPALISSQTGISFGDAMNVNGAPAAPKGNRSAAFMKSAMSIGDPDEKRLVMAGVRPDLAKKFVADGKAAGVDPGVLATLAAMESGGGDLSKIKPGTGWSGVNRNGTRDFGMMGINSNDPLSPYSQTGLDPNILSGAAIFNSKAARAGGSLQKQFSLYNGTGPKAAAYGQSAMSIYSSIGGTATADSLGMPPSSALSANAQQGNLFTANQVLDKFGDAAGKATTAIDAFASALKHATGALSGLSPGQITSLGLLGPFGLFGGNKGAQISP